MDRHQVGPLDTLGKRTGLTGHCILQPSGMQCPSIRQVSPPDVAVLLKAATSLTLLVQSFADCAATVSINSSSPIPACTAGSSADDTPFSLYNLPVGLHHVEWDSGEVPAGEQVIFWGFEGTRPGDASGMTNVTIDDTYKGGGGVQYAWHGDWATTAGTDANELDFNRTLALTSRQGASVNFQGAGEQIAA